MLVDHIVEKVEKDLRSLVEISKKNQNKISFSIVIDVLMENKFDIQYYNEVEIYFQKFNIQITHDDVEDIDESFVSDPERILNKVNPFDPTKVDISMKSMTLDLLIRRLRFKEINLFPDFQRKGGLWTIGQKSRLIESLLLRIPLPAFFFDGSDNDEWLVIDGLQRLTAIQEFFIDNNYSLSGLEFLTDLNGCNAGSLPRAHLRRIEETQIIAYIINPGAPVNLKFNIFKRINTGGLQLEPQEIRHALYQGNATILLKNLAEEKSFVSATCGSIKTDRMLDREFVLRYIAFSELSLSEYDGSIDSFLNLAMSTINKFDNEKMLEIKDNFIHAMELSEKIFGRFAFRKMYDEQRRNPINKALFEAWSVSLGRLTKLEVQSLIKNRRKLVKSFISTMKLSMTFENSIKSGDASSVKKRFEIVGQLIGGMLNDFSN